MQLISCSIFALVAFGFIIATFASDKKHDLKMCCGGEKLSVSEEYIKEVRTCEKDLPEMGNNTEEQIDFASCYFDCLANKENLLDKTSNNLIKENYFNYIKRMVPAEHYDLVGKTIEDSYDSCLEQVETEKKNFESVKCGVTFLGMVICTTNRVLTECPADKLVKDEHCNIILQVSGSINSTFSAFFS